MVLYKVDWYVLNYLPPLHTQPLPYLDKAIHTATYAANCKVLIGYSLASCVVVKWVPRCLGWWSVFDYMKYPESAH